MNIPDKLKDGDFRFLLVRPKEKKPFELEWQKKNNYSYDDPKLLKHFEAKGNYGVIGGYGRLRILDIDDKLLASIMIRKLDTFTVETCGGGYHFYFISDYNKNHVFKDDRGELRGNRYMVVGPNSYAIDKKKGHEGYYKVIKDLPIKEMSETEMRNLINPFLKPEVREIEIKEEKKTVDKSRSGIEYREICKLISKGLDKEKIFQHMIAFEKWNHASPQYKELTYNKAKNYIEESKKNRLKKVIPSGFKFKEAIRTFTDYIDLAEQFIKIQPIFYDKAQLWWCWNFDSNSWGIIDEVDIMNLIDSNTENIPTINSTIKNQILEGLKRVGRMKTPEPFNETWVQFKNKIIDFTDGKEIEVSPDYFATNPIPHDIGDSEETPVMDKIFKEWVGEKYVSTLYEIIAFSMSSNYFIHRIFCLIGSGLNGKSKFLELLKNFIGLDNTTSTELDVLLKSRFESAKLYKKLICCMGETNFNTLTKTSLLKRLTGEDLIGFEFKNKTPFDEHNYSKIIIATNTLPITLDKTKGFFRRWLIIDFPNVFTEKRNILSDIPDQEYSNLAKKSIRILSELHTKREFTNEGTIEDRSQKYEEKSNPLIMFLKDYCDIDNNNQIEFSIFYDAYTDFLTERNYRIQNRNEVGRLLKHEGYDSKIIKKKSNDLFGENREVNTRFILGLSIKK